MNIRPLRLIVLSAALLATVSSVLAQGTAFTYQGRLNDGAAPANGSYDLTFTLQSAVTGATQVGGVVTRNATAVSNGLFIVSLDFGNQFPGADRWLEIGVKTNGAGGFTTLTPRQALAATPHAITAGNLSGTLPTGGLAGTYGGALILNNAGNSFSGNGGNLTGLNASQLNGGTVPAVALGNAWKTTGNTGANPTNGAFLGTTDNQPLEFKVNGQRALRLEYAVAASGIGVNVIGGYSGNVVNNAIYATIAGGGDGGNINQVTDSYGTVGGGRGNRAGYLGTVAGGELNSASGFYSMVPGGAKNTAAGQLSFAAGYRATANHEGAFVWSDFSVLFNDFASTGPNQFLVRAGGGVGINTNNPNGAALAVNGTVTATSFTGNGSGLTGVTAAAFTGLVGDSQLSANVARRDQVNSFTANQAIQGSLAVAGPVSGTSFTGDGSPLTGVAKLGSSNAFGAGSSFNGTVTATAFSGNGSALTGVAALGSANTFLSDNTFIGLISAETMNSSTFVRVDARGLNNGAIFGVDAPGLTFGGGSSGEGIASKRTAGGNQFSLDFYTSYAARLSINGGSGGGRVGIGRVSTANQLEVEGNASKTTAGSWLANSDRRIKQDIAPVTGALAKLNQVRLVSFHYTDAYRKAHALAEDRPYLNVVAQEFAQVFPEHVKSSGEKLPDGSEILQVDTYPLTIYAAAAVQELNRKVEEKDAKITALEQRLEKLERLMEAKGGSR